MNPENISLEKPESILNSELVMINEKLETLDIVPIIKGAGGGGNGDYGQSPWTNNGPGSRGSGSGADGGLYGGGAGGWGNGVFSGYGGGYGAQGGCRIIWGKDRAFPGTLTDDIA